MIYSEVLSDLLSGGLNSVLESLYSWQRGPVEGREYILLSLHKSLKGLFSDPYNVEHLNIKGLTSLVLPFQKYEKLLAKIRFGL